MGRAISNKNVQEAKFEVADFDGEFLASFGKPELRGVWFVYGGSGCGKTTFVMMICKYLTRFRKTAYNSLEQGLSLSLQTAWNRVNMAEAGNQIILLEKETLKELTERLQKRKSPDVVVIDSIHYWRRFTFDDYKTLKERFSNKLFIFIAHEQNGQPRGSLARSIRFDADIKMHVVGYKASVTTRFERTDEETGAHEGGADFVIWEEGAREYWGETVDNE